MVPAGISTNPNGDTARGIACGAGAGALWGLVFLAPEVIREFHPLLQAIGRYVAYGLIALVLIGPRWRGLAAALDTRAWLALAWLALCGNVLYYVLLATAVTQGGIALTSLIVGFLPVVITLVGRRDHGAAPLRRLLPSLLLCVAGALCIGWQAVIEMAAGTRPGQLFGIVCAIAALASWTAYAVSNARWLARLDTISAHDWNLGLGVMTGAQSLLLIPFALVFTSIDHDAAGWLRFAGVSIGVAVFASILGNLLWNRMSRLLPLTLVGQMILFETLFALIYGFLWEQRWPTLLECAAFTFVAASVVTCIGAHRPRRAAVGSPALT